MLGVEVETVELDDGLKAGRVMVFKEGRLGFGDGVEFRDGRNEE